MRVSWNGVDGQRVKKERKDMKEKREKGIKDKRTPTLGSVSASPFGRSEEQRVLCGALSAVINIPGTKGGEIPERVYDC